MPPTDLSRTDAPDPGSATPAGPPPPPEVDDGDAPRSAAATWVAAVGALLLLAAAGTFLVVSWDALGLVARVAVVGTVTVGAITGGARLRRVLPAVGAVLFHLGALLVPVDVLGLALHLEASPGAIWLATGVTTVVVLPVLAVTGRSWLLAALALPGVPVTAVGLGLLGVVPPTLVTLTAAASLLLVRSPAANRRGARRPVDVLGWAPAALAATTATALALVGGALGFGVPVVSPLGQLLRAGWAGGSWATLAAGAAGAVLVGAAAAWSRRTSASFALLLVTVVTAAVAVAVAPGAPEVARILPIPLAFLGAELTAAVTARAGLSTPSRLVGGVEAVAALVGAGFGVAAVLGGGEPDLPLATAAAVVALAWGVGVARRRPAVGAVTAATNLAVAAIVVLAASGAPHLATVATLVVAAAATLAACGRGRDAGRVGAAAALWLGTLTTIATGALPEGPNDGSAAGATLLVAIGLVLLLAAHLWRHASEHPADGPAAAVVLGGAGVLTVWFGWGAAGAAARAWSLPAAAAAATVVLAASLLALAAAADTVPTAGDTLRGVGLLWSVLLPIEDALTAAGAGTGAGAAELATFVGVAALVSADAVRTRRDWLHLAAAVLVARGLWALGDAEVVGWAALAVGAAVAAAGVATRREAVGHGGGALANVGLWLVLEQRGVTSLDVWILGPALQLWAAGMVARRRSDGSSWVHDVPPLLLAAVPAVVTRLAGGGGWHAVLAGALGVAAVTLGGTQRLAGPLVVGTVLVATVVVGEAFAVVAAVPTWAWLAVGGTTLLGTAILIERTDGAPVDRARRLLDVVEERFR